jgi:hypothetical protein
MKSSRKEAMRNVVDAVKDAVRAKYLLDSTSETEKGIEKLAAIRSKVPSHIPSPI